MLDAGDTFARSLASVSVVMITQKNGLGGAPAFTTMQCSSMESLLGILTRYLRAIGTLSSQAAQHAGRAEANLLDVCFALESVGAASLRQLIAFSRVRELPYPYPVLICPTVQPSNIGIVGSGSHFMSWASEVRPAHVPEFTPPFPELATYNKNTVRQRRELNVQVGWRKRSRLKRDAQDQLHSLQQASSQAQELLPLGFLAHDGPSFVSGPTALMSNSTSPPPVPFVPSPAPPPLTLVTLALLLPSLFFLSKVMPPSQQASKEAHTLTLLPQASAVTCAATLPAPLPAAASDARAWSSRAASPNASIAQTVFAGELAGCASAVLQSSAGHEYCGLPGTVAVLQPLVGLALGADGNEPSAIGAQPRANDECGGSKLKIDVMLGLQHLHDLDEVADTKYSGDANAG